MAPGPSRGPGDGAERDTERSFHPTPLSSRGHLPSRGARGHSRRVLSLPGGPCSETEFCPKGHGNCVCVREDTEKGVNRGKSWPKTAKLELRLVSSEETGKPERFFYSFFFSLASYSTLVFGVGWMKTQNKGHKNNVVSGECVLIPCDSRHHQISGGQNWHFLKACLHVTRFLFSSILQHHWQVVVPGFGSHEALPLKS